MKKNRPGALPGRAWWVLTLFTAFALPPLFAQTAAELRNDYLDRIQVIDAQLDEQQATIRVHYFKLLDDYIFFSTGRNDTEQVRWAQAEKLRYDRNPAIAVTDLAHIDGKVKRTQAELKRALNLAQLRWEQEYIDQTQAYAKSLEKQAATYQAVQQTQLAQSLRTERTRALENQVYLNALAHFHAYQSGNQAELDRIEAAGQETVLYENEFNGPALSEEWQSSNEDYAIQNGKLIVTTDGTILNLARYFKGNFRIELSVQKTGARDASSELDFAIILKTPKVATIIGYTGDRLSTFMLNHDAMKLDLVRELKSTGTLTLTHRNGKLRAEYRDFEGQVLATSWRNVPAFEKTLLQFRIAGQGAESPRMIEHLKVVGLPE